MSETSGTGKELSSALGQLPTLMAELMKDFIEKKELTARVQIRRRMKALLDLVWVDTVHPPNPSLEKKAGPGAAREAVLNMAPMDNATAQPYAIQPVLGGGLGGVGYVAPVPGARRADEDPNVEILG